MTPLSDLVHRDVTPANTLFLLHSLSWKLLDVGIVERSGAPLPCLRARPPRFDRRRMERQWESTKPTMKRSGRGGCRGRRVAALHTAQCECLVT